MVNRDGFENHIALRDARVRISPPPQYRKLLNMKNNQQLTISGAIVFKDYRGKRSFLVVKQKEDSDWEIPKVIVRKGESSVRAAIRLTSEQAGMNARVLEEAGRSTGVASVNGKTVPQKLYYYLMLLKAAGEIIGFEEFKWFQFADAIRKIQLKREKEMLRSAKEVLRTWEKTHKVQNY